MAAGGPLRRDTQLRDNGATRGLRGNYTGFRTLTRHRRRRGPRAHRRLGRHPTPRPIMHRPGPSPNPQRIGLLLDDRPVQVLAPNLLDSSLAPQTARATDQCTEFAHLISDDRSGPCRMIERSQRPEKVLLIDIDPLSIISTLSHPIQASSPKITRPPHRGSKK